MSHRNKIIIASSMALLILFTIFFLILKNWSGSPASDQSFNTSVVVNITSENEVCEQLVKDELISSTFFCSLYKTFLFKGEVAAGSYQVRSQMTPSELFATFANSGNLLSDVKRMNLSQKWYVEILGPAQDIDLIKSSKQKLSELLLGKEWMMRKDGTEVVAFQPSSEVQKTVIFLEENSDKRIRSFRKTADKVFLFRIWVKRVEDQVVMTASAFAPSKECIGLTLSDDRCQSWHRFIKPQVFQFTPEKAVAAIIEKVKNIPFTAEY